MRSIKHKCLLLTFMKQESLKLTESTIKTGPLIQIVIYFFPKLDFFIIYHPNHKRPVPTKTS